MSVDPENPNNINIRGAVHPHSEVAAERRRVHEAALKAHDAQDPDALYKLYEGVVDDRARIETALRTVLELDQREKERASDVSVAVQALRDVALAAIEAVKDIRN